jgi:hypothetical protein
MSSEIVDAISTHRLLSGMAWTVLNGNDRLRKRHLRHLQIVSLFDWLELS